MIDEPVPTRDGAGDQANREDEEEIQSICPPRIAPGEFLTQDYGPKSIVRNQQGAPVQIPTSMLRA
jgi:hypothetical protein